MSNSEDWIPGPLAEFKAFGDNFCTEVTANKTAWGVDSVDSTTLIAKQTIFNDDYAVSSVKGHHTSLDTQETNEARPPYEAIIRKMGMAMKTNDLMTDVNRTACGVHNDSEAHTLSPVAAVSPTVQYERSGDLGSNIDFGDPTAGRPNGQEGISVTFGFYAVGATKPTEANCTKTVMFKKKTGHVVFAEAQFGMAFVAFARYYNTRAVLGTVATKFEGIVS